MCCVLDDRPRLRLTGNVRLQKKGGFIQASLDLAHPGESLDAMTSNVQSDITPIERLAIKLAMYRRSLFKAVVLRCRRSHFHHIRIG